MNDTHGTAAWATYWDLRKAGMLDSAGLLIGREDGFFPSDIYHNGDGHILTVAPPGSGKTAALVIPNLAHYRGSVVVTDPKGALTAQTAALRRDGLGQRVVVLNPWRDEMTDALGRDLGDTGFNPLAILKDDRSLHDNAKFIGNLLCPTPPDERDPYWTQAARSVLIGVLMFMVKSGGPVTLPRLARLVRDTREGWQGLAGDMVALGGLLEEYGAETLGVLESEKQWAGVLGKIHNATDLYRAGDPLGEHTARDEFDPADLKRQDMTVYIIIPSNRRDANKAWLGLVMALMAEAVGRPGPAREVLLLAEEFANLGYMPTLTRAMAEYREAGLKVWLIVQSLNQLARLYGQDGHNEIVQLCDTKQFFAVGDYETARQLSAAVGQKTVQVTSYGHEPEAIFGDIGDKRSANVSETGVPLIRPEDILKLSNRDQIILRTGAVPPIKAKLVPFFETPKIAEKLDPNPYRPAPDPEPQTRTAEPRRVVPKRDVSNINQMFMVLAVIIVPLSAIEKGLNGALGATGGFLVAYLAARAYQAWKATW